MSNASPSIPLPPDTPSHPAFGASIPAIQSAPALSVWLTVEQIRKSQRMRRETVIAAMESGELPYERRGRIRYARLADVQMWEERRLAAHSRPSAPARAIAPELADLM